MKFLPLIGCCAVIETLELRLVRNDFVGDEPYSFKHVGICTIVLYRGTKSAVVRHAVLEQYNDCRYRKSIRGSIPMYVFAAVYVLYFLQALIVSLFTSRTPNKDKEVEQRFYRLFI